MGRRKVSIAFEPRPSNCEDDPAERPALNQVTQRCSRVAKRKALMG